MMEALNNAILHCEPESRHRPVEILLVCFPDEIELTVTDHTPGFDWPETVVLPTETDVSGRGLFLIDSLMDEVAYHRGGERNWLIAKRKLTPVPRPTQNTETITNELRKSLDESNSTLELMTEELSSCYESLSAIYCFSQELGKANETRAFAGQVLGHLSRIIDADWFVCRLHPPGSNRLETLVESGPETVTPSIEFDTAGSLEVQAVHSRQDQWFGSEEALSPDDLLLSFGDDQSGIVHPCHLHDTLVGVITLGRSASQPGFKSGEISMLHTLADFLMIHIINSRFQESRVESQLVEIELKIARQIQCSLYPEVFPTIHDCASIGWTRSARQVGGDYYDAIEVGPHEMLLVIADVMGKGVPAAMFAAVLRSAIRTASEDWRHPGRLMTHVNNVLLKDLKQTEVFITAQVLHIDVAAGAIRFANAGHLPFLTATPGAGAPSRHSTDNMPLGVGGKVLFEEREFALQPGLRLALYSDGIIDAVSATGERFGFERLENWIQDSSDNHFDTDRMRLELTRRLDSFEGKVAQSDDQTLLALTVPDSFRRIPNPSEPSEGQSINAI